MSGALVKLTIIPFQDAEGTPIPSGPPFILPFNPETFSVANELEYTPNDKPGSSGSEQKFYRIKPRNFSFEIFLDGTGAGGVKIPVHPLIKLFEVSTGVIGNIHRPGFFMISWGPRVYKAVLKKYTVNYKLFSPEGMPLRAVISTEWEEMTSTGFLAKALNFLSPDVTHRHTVVSGEHLSLITHRTYKTDRYYVDVARKNGLDDLRYLNPGHVLALYPLE